VSAFLLGYALEGEGIENYLLAKRT
jgi:hypothetical protein